MAAIDQIYWKSTRLKKDYWPEKGAKSSKAVLIRSIGENYILYSEVKVW